MVVHAQAVDTRPLSPLLRGLGTRLCHIPTDCVDDITSTSLTCKLNQTYKTHLLEQHLFLLWLLQTREEPPCHGVLELEQEHSASGTLLHLHITR